MIKPKHINQIAEQMKLSKPKKDTLQVCEEMEECKPLPTWIDELFFKFQLEYGNLWSNSIPTSVTYYAKGKIYFDALKKYDVDIIDKAGSAYLGLYKYPELNQLVSLCDEIVEQERMKKERECELLLTHNVQQKRELTDVGKKTLEEIKKKLSSKK